MKNLNQKHNYGYWSKDDYIGVGAGAVACIENRRMYKQKNIENIYKIQFMKILKS